MCSIQVHILIETIMDNPNLFIHVKYHMIYNIVQVKHEK
jgi:hypothetical protein